MDFVGSVHPDAFEPLNPEDQWQESVAVLILHQTRTGLSLISLTAANSLSQVPTEGFGGFVVLGVRFDISLARDPELATQGTDEFAHPAFAQLNADALHNSRLGDARFNLGAAGL